MTLDRRKRKFILLGLLLTCGCILYSLFCQGCIDKGILTHFDGSVKRGAIHEHFTDPDLVRDYDFDMDKDDVIVFLHMQKTGGTSFGKHLVNDIDLKVPCDCTIARKRCLCENSKKQIWLFSRYSTGWMCGLHADWTELKECVNSMLDHKENSSRKRRYLYITLLRDPVKRYMSEWKHVQRGATWLAANLHCNGRSATLQEVPFCFTDEDWGGVSLEDFLACPHNLANNRQTRMLANLSLVGCYNMSAMAPNQRDAIVLQSAKDNLRDMAFFGLTECQEDTRYMFERTFHVKFLEDFVQHEESHATSVNLSSTDYQKIVDANRLDIELYQYAKELFTQRLLKLRSEAFWDSSTSNKDTPTQKYGASQSHNTARQKHKAHVLEFTEGDDNTDYDGNEYGDLNSKRISQKQPGRHRRRKLNQGHVEEVT